MSLPELDISTLKILVIDDNAFMRSIVVNVLKSFRCNSVMTATDGADAFHVMLAYHPDIIITAWKMLPLDGIEFTRMLRAKTGDPDEMTPIIMMTAHSEAIRVTQSRDAGVNEFLAKPLSATTLYARLVSVIMYPRPFVRAPNYKGPCRHRHKGGSYGGPKRRGDDEAFDIGMPRDDDED